MRNGLFARAVFWLGIAGLLWIVMCAIFTPLRVST
jgi:hypothetical protein